MTNDEKSFKNAAPTLFGDEFAKLATERVDQLKAISKFSKPEQKKSNLYFGYNPQNSSRGGRGVGTKAAEDGSTLIQRTATSDQTKATKDRNSKKISHLNCMPIDIHIESHHTGFRTNALSMILPSIERGIVTMVHAG